MKQTPRHREHTWLPRGRNCRGRMNWESGLADANYYILNGYPTRSYCIEQGTMLKIS